MSFSLAVFENRYENFIESGFVKSVGGVRVFQNQNINKVEISGAELAAQWQFAPQWRLRGSIAYARGDNKTAGQPLNSVEPLTGVFGVGYKAADDRWGLEVLWTVVDAKDRVAEETDVTNHGYGVVDLVGHYRFNDAVNFRVGVFNLLDREYAEWGSLQDIDAIDLDAVARASQPGLNLRASLSMDF